MWAWRVCVRRGLGVEREGFDGKLLVCPLVDCEATSFTLGEYSGGSCLVVKIVGLMFGVTVLGVLFIVGEYTVDSSEADLFAS